MASLLRRLLAPALTVVVACAAALAVPSPASAATGSITCVGTTQITFNPGLTYQQQPVHATESTQLSPCTSTEPGERAAAGRSRTWQIAAASRRSTGDSQHVPSMPCLTTRL